MSDMSGADLVKEYLQVERYLLVDSDEISDLSSITEEEKVDKIRKTNRAVEIDAIYIISGDDVWNPTL